MTTVGSASASSESFYGTSDQSGNAYEWNEETVAGGQRVRRGGSFFIGAPGLQSSSQFSGFPSTEDVSTSFRVAAFIGPVPAVSTWGMTTLVLLVLIAGTVVFRRRAVG